MRIIKTVILRNHNNRKFVIGVPVTDEEFNQMFEFRYKSYFESGYIDDSKKNDFKDIDKYDIAKKCLYIIATVDNEIIGTSRLIKDSPLPTKKYFNFTEPDIIKNIPSHKRGEVSRLISKYPLSIKNIVPPHFITIMLLLGLIELAVDGGIEGGYCFIKKYLFDILDSLKVPVYEIKPSELIYKEKYLYPFFYNFPKNPVIPIYYKTHEIITRTNKLIEHVAQVENIQMINNNRIQ